MQTKIIFEKSLRDSIKEKNELLTQQLVDFGEKENLLSDDDRVQMFYLSLELGHTEISGILFHKGSIPIKISEDIALNAALGNGTKESRAKSLDWLISHGVNPNQKICLGRGEFLFGDGFSNVTEFVFQRLGDNTAAADVLLKHGIKPTIQDLNRGFETLLYSDLDAEELFEWFTKHKFDVLKGLNQVAYDMNNPDCRYFKTAAMKSVFPAYFYGEGWDPQLLIDLGASLDLYIQENGENYFLHIAKDTKASRWIDLIKKVLKEQGLPEELKLDPTQKQTPWPPFREFLGTQTV